MIGRTLVVAHPVLVAARADVALADRPAGMKPLAGTAASSAGRPMACNGGLVAALVELDGQAWSVMDLGAVATPSCTLPSPSAGRKAVGPVDPRDLGLATAIATAGALAALVA